MLTRDPVWPYPLHVMSETIRVQVLMSPQEAEDFEAYCREQGFKKSTLIARLIREHLQREHFTQQKVLFTEGPTAR